MSDILAQATEFANRRIQLGQDMPHCHRCGSAQVQLTWWTGPPPAEWKCRQCDAEFMFEPIHSYVGEKK